MKPPLIGPLLEKLTSLADVGPTLTSLSEEMARTREVMQDVADQMNRVATLVETAIARMESAEDTVDGARRAVLDTGETMQAEGVRLREESAQVREAISTALAEVEKATDTATRLASAADSVPGVDAEPEPR